MVGVETALVLYMVKLAPLFILLGMVFTAVINRLGSGGGGVFVPRDAIIDENGDFGGNFPAIFGAVHGITWGIFVESVLLGMTFGAYHFGDFFGPKDFFSACAFSIMFGIAVAFWQSFEKQADIRNSDWYRGWG